MSPAATLSPETRVPVREERTFAASRETPRVARVWIEELAKQAGTQDDVRFRLGTACAEALSNACRHAYRADETGTVHVAVRETDGELAVTIRDEGGGFDPTACAAPRSSDLAEGGYGLSLMDRLVDRFTLSAKPGRGTEARLVVAISAQPDNAAI